MKKSNVAIFAAAAAAGVYSAVNGKGIFNKIRFKEQHDAISRYVDSHYKNALYTPIEQTSKGWVTVIRRPGIEKKVILYVFRAENGMYVFKETLIK